MGLLNSKGKNQQLLYLALLLAELNSCEGGMAESINDTICSSRVYGNADELKLAALQADESAT